MGHGTRAATSSRAKRGTFRIPDTWSPEVPRFAQDEGCGSFPRLSSLVYGLAFPPSAMNLIVPSGIFRHNVRYFDLLGVPPLVGVIVA